VLLLMAISNLVNHMLDRVVTADAPTLIIHTSTTTGSS